MGTLAEFRGRAGLVAASAWCTSMGAGATMFYSLGAFIPPLQAEFGWSRGRISFGATVMSGAIFLMAPIIGRLCDRIGSAAVAAASFVLYAFALLAMSFALDGYAGFLMFYFAIAALGSGVMPVAIVRPLVQSFEANRGLALGFAMTGAGLAAFWVPQLVTAVVETHGWRTAYRAIALLALFAAPIAFFYLRPRPSEDSVAQASMAATTADGGIWQNRWFWTLCIVALSMGTGISGMVIHLLPLLRDAGLSGDKAATAASLIGLSSVAARFGFGPLLDRFNAAVVASVATASALVGLVLLMIDPLSFGYAAGILLGVSLGSEADALAFLTSRLFDERHYSTIYGWVFSAFTLGYGISPFAVGALYDVMGRYQEALLISMALLLISVALTLSLRRRLPPSR